MSTQTANQYPEDALLLNSELDVINCYDVHTLDELFRERVRRSPDKVAYTQFEPTSNQWRSVTWSDMATQVERWQVALKQDGLTKGDRVAIRYRNSIEWVVFDQAALRLGLVVVPLYVADRVENVSYVIHDSGARLVLLNDVQEWQQVEQCDDDLSCVQRVLLLHNDSESALLQSIDDWLPDVGQHLERGLAEPDDLASIVYTSGTTGRPKGVMLSHKNMLSNAYSGMRSVPLRPSDRLLSFLPLSHTLERTVGYYAAIMCGSSVTYNRSIADLSDDLCLVSPSVLISVPRIFERVYNKLYSSLTEMNVFKQCLFKYAIKVGWYRFEYQQGLVKWHPRLLCDPLLKRLVAQPIKQRLGGNLEYAIVGGAPLSLAVSKTFLALDILLLQGYGLTEASPVISVNTPEHNRPDSIGLLLRGVEARIIDNDELCVKGDNVMLGYWQNQQATQNTFDGDWLKTGDRASIDEQGFIRIIGRIKDILVLANGEKVPPADIEAAIARDTLFEQVLLVGEGKPFLSALIVLDKTEWQTQKKQHNLGDVNSLSTHEYLLDRIALQMEEFPGYARIRKVHLVFDEWTVESGLLTPTLKIKRPKVIAHYQDHIARLYQGH